MDLQPCQPSENAGSHAAVHTPPSAPTTNTSNLSALRETQVTGAPGAASPSRTCHHPCHQSVKPGSHAALTTLPSTSVPKMSSRSALRDTTCIGDPGGKRVSPMRPQPCQPSENPGSQAAVLTAPSRSVTETSRWSRLRDTP